MERNAQSVAAVLLEAENDFPARSQQWSARADEYRWKHNFTHDRLGVTIQQQRNGATMQVFLRVSGPAIFVISRLKKPIEFNTDTLEFVFPKFFLGGFLFQNNSANRETLGVLIKVLRTLAANPPGPCPFSISRANILAIASRELVANPDFPSAAPSPGDTAEFEIATGGPVLEIRAFSKSGVIRVTGMIVLILENLHRMNDTRRDMGVGDLNFRAATRTRTYPDTDVDKVSLLFENNATNRNTLQMAAEVAAATAARFRLWEITNSAPLVDMTGTAACPEMPTNMAAVIEEGGIRRMPLAEAPRRVGGVWTFGRDGLHESVAKSAIQFLQRHSRWGQRISLVPGDYFDLSEDDIDGQTDTMGYLFRMLLKRKRRHKNDTIVCWTSWNEHVRLIFYPGSGNDWYVIDPWKTSRLVKDEFGFQLLKAAGKMYGQDVHFIERTAEQETEGSCGYLMMARAIQIAREGWHVIRDPLDDCTVFFTSQLLAHIMKKEHPAFDERQRFTSL